MLSCLRCVVPAHATVRRLTIPAGLVDRQGGLYPATPAFALLQSLLGTAGCMPFLIPCQELLWHGSPDQYD